MTTDDEGQIVPIRGEIVPSHPGDSWPDDVREDVYQAFKVTRSAARARRWYLKQAGEDMPAPAESTIKDWIRFYAWPDRAEAEYRLEHGYLGYLTDRQELANYSLALEVEADVMTGAYDDNVLAGALRLKGSENAQRRRQYQQKVIAPKPPEQITESGEVDRDTGEAIAKSAMIRRGKGTG